MRHYANNALIENFKNFDQESNYIIYDPSIRGLKLPYENDIMTGEELLIRLDNICDYMGCIYEAPIAMSNGDLEDKDGLILATKTDLDDFRKTSIYIYKKKDNKITIERNK